MPLSTAVKDCAWRLHWKLPDKPGYSDIIAALHYPPLYDAANESVFVELLERYGVRHCVFGHIHGSDASMVFEGIHNGITYKLVSCDTQDFTPQLVK